MRRGGVAVTSSPVLATPSSYSQINCLCRPGWLRQRRRRLVPPAEVEVGGVHTRVLAEQAAAVDPGRLGKSVGFLSFDEMRRVDAALRIVLDL
jgi:mRNA-degrading endonuclease toxin of MazEF toxin-antitoxin module